MGATLTALGAIELLSGETRAAREMYRRAAERFAPWPRFAGWLRLVAAELSTSWPTTVEPTARWPQPQASSTVRSASSPVDGWLRCVTGNAGGDAWAASR